MVEAELAALASRLLARRAGTGVVRAPEPSRTSERLDALARDTARFPGLVDNSRNIKAVGLPIIGINKVLVNGTALITPRFDMVSALADAGASVVALELTRRAYPVEDDYDHALAQVANRHASGRVALMADIGTFD